MNPDLTTAQIDLASLLVQRGRLNEAEQFVKTAATKVPRDTEVRFLQASIDVKGRQIVPAEKQLVELAKELPASPGIQIELGRLRLAQNQIPAARGIFERVLLQHPDNVEALSELTALDLRTNRAAQARQRLNETVERFPRDARVLVTAGVGYSLAGEPARAEAALRTAIDVDPLRSDAYGYLAQLYLAQRQPDKALAEFEKLAERSPRNMSPHYVRGTVLEALNRREEAKEAYRRALSIAPDAALPANSLAYLYAVDGARLEEALQLARSARSQLKYSPDVADTLGFVLYKLGKATEAVPLLEEAVKGRPNDTSYQFHLGLAYAGSSESWPQARATLEAALKRSPDNLHAAEARTALARLAAIGL